MTKVELRPFLLKAYHDWFTASGIKVFIRALYDDISYPEWLKKYVTPDESLVFNISSMAVRNLQIDEGGVSFDAKFSGKQVSIFIPLHTLVSMHGEGSGVYFRIDEEIEPRNYISELRDALESSVVKEEETKQPEIKEKKKPFLRLVK